MMFKNVGFKNQLLSRKVKAPNLKLLSHTKRFLNSLLSPQREEFHKLLQKNLRLKETKRLFRPGIPTANRCPLSGAPLLAPDALVVYCGGCASPRPIEEARKKTESIFKRFSLGDILPRSLRLRVFRTFTD